MSNSAERIMYIERGGGLSGARRIGLVKFSKTGRTLYYRDRSFCPIKSYKANYLDEESREEYWISGPRKDGQDTLYPGEVEIDEDIRERYWVEVRSLPDESSKSSFRSLGRHAKRSVR